MGSQLWVAKKKKKILISFSVQGCTYPEFLPESRKEFAAREESHWGTQQGTDTIPISTGLART